MARPVPPAQLRSWRGQWYVFCHDWKFSPPRRMRVSCRSRNAFDQIARKRLLDSIREEEILLRAEAVRLGGTIAYDSRLLKCVQEYVEDVEQRIKVRQANPLARAGLSPHTGLIINDAMKRFVAWLKEAGYERMQTGQLGPHHLRAYLEHLATEPSSHGERRVIRSGATLNHHRRHLRACLNWIADMRPKRFPDADSFKRPLKPQLVAPREDVACTPDELLKFYRMAVQREDPNCPMEVTRRKRGRLENFMQRPPAVAATPVSRLFLLLALTGMRLSEALNLKWTNINFETGWVRVYSEKTGRPRTLQLIDAPEGKLCPRFLELLKRWKLQAGDRAHVLPHGDLAAPIHPKTPWESTVRAAKTRRIGPQTLRRNWVSFCASIGIPAAVAALWAGHSAAVAEKHYRLQVMSRHDGTLEQAMGLDVVIDELITSSVNRGAQA